MKQLDLSDEEAHELCVALNTRLEQMLHELVHTDDTAYRDELHKSLDRLEKIAEKVGYTIPRTSELRR
jgi:hypothetical protein